MDETTIATFSIVLHADGKYTVRVSDVSGTDCESMRFDTYRDALADAARGIVHMAWHDGHDTVSR